MSSPDSTGNQFTTPNSSPVGETARGRRARLREQQVSLAQVNQQTEAVLHSLDRVRNLINFEVDYVNVRCAQEQHTSIRRPTQRLNSLVQQRLAYFESKSTTNIASSSTCFLSGLPLHEPNIDHELAVASAPASPRRPRTNTQVSPISATASTMPNGGSTGGTGGIAEVIPLVIT